MDRREADVLLDLVNEFHAVRRQLDSICERISRVEMSINSTQCALDRYVDVKRQLRRIERERRRLIVERTQ